MNVSTGPRESHAAFILRMRARGVNDIALFSAFETVRREEFLAPEWRRAAWSAGMLPIACGEAMESLDTQALMIGALDLRGGERVLEIGTGSGYTAAVMATLGARVVTLERFRTLSTDAQARFERLGIPATVRLADGCKGLHAEGPYDRVIAWAAFDQLPRFLGDQVASNGIVVAPMGPGEGVQSVLKLTKIGSRFDREDIGTARFQALVPGLAAAI